MATMEFVKTNAGVLMPKIIYGTAWKEDRTTALVEEALNKGFMGIDTACQPKHYQEPLVGEALARYYQQGGSREHLFIQTKYTSVAGQDPQRIPYDATASVYDQVLQSCQVSLKNLNATYLDSLVQHGPERDFDDQLEVWRALESIVKEGGARQIGISNCYSLAFLKALYDQAEIKPAVVQNRFYRDTDFDRALRTWCFEQGIYYQGFWTLSHNGYILEDPAMLALAERYGRTPAQIMFRYLTQIGVTPLTGTSSSVHMEEDLAIFEFELADADCDVIDRLCV